MKRFFFLLIILLIVSSLFAKERDRFMLRRKEMIDDQIIPRGVADPQVLKALESVERHLFVPQNQIEHAYEDHPLPIGDGQTISQPYIVALMTEQARLQSHHKVLEIGTGSGYQAAVLAKIAKEVYSIEIVESLANSAQKRLEKLGYKNISIKHGDGYQGWEEYAPFDAILVTAAPPEIPDKLVKQLKMGGRMVIPVGDFYQELLVIIKTEDGIKKEPLIPVRFVPMVHPK